MRPDEFYGDGDDTLERTSWWRDVFLNPALIPAETYSKLSLDDTVAF